MSFATIAGWLMSGFAMRVYAAGFSVWLATQVIGTVVPALHAVSAAFKVAA